MSDHATHTNGKANGHAPPPAPGEEMAEHLAFLWHALHALPGSCQDMVAGPWDKPNPDPRTLTGLCVRMFRANGWIIEHVLELAAHFPDGLGKLSNHAELIRELWKEQADQEQAEADAKAARIAALLTITDAAWDPATIPPRPWLGPPYLG